MADETITGTGTASLRLDCTDDVTAFAQLALASSRRCHLQMVAATGGASVIDLDPQVPDGAGECMTRLFRSTQTTSRAALEIFAADGSSSLTHSLAGHGDSFLAARGGRVGIGTVEPQYTLDVTGDVGLSGSLRLGAAGVSHVIGSGTVDTSRQLLLTGAFTGSAESVALGVNTDLHGLPEADISLVKINGTVHSAESGTNRIQTCLMIKPSFEAHGAENVGTYGAVIRQYVAPVNAPIATGLAVDCPLGAPTNYAMQISGSTLLRGSSPILFAQTEGMNDALIAGATGPGAYVEGAETGDLVFRTAHHALWWTADAGTPHLKLTPDAFTLYVSPQFAGPQTDSNAWTWVETRIADGSTGYLKVWKSRE